jgi:hypothetical protein
MLFSNVFYFETSSRAYNNTTLNYKFYPLEYRSKAAPYYSKAIEEFKRSAVYVMRPVPPYDSFFFFNKKEVIDSKFPNMYIIQMR